MSISRQPIHPTDYDLNQARQRGDAVADQLAREIIAGVPFDQANGRLGYHQLLGVADVLLSAPELFLMDHSTVTQVLRKMPAQYVDYFDPVAAPDWVDEAKLRRASEIWDNNMLAIIGVLYASSLPECYLIGNGIPALYQTGRLGQYKFIYQRIYETGLMLDAVMEQGGLSVFRDLPTKDNTDGQRYVWGRGFVAARKVRMLHASMRVMLTEPHVIREAMADGDKIPTAFNATSIGAMMAGRKNSNEVVYDTKKLGMPVNQEDLAYTLLTFGLSIPEGLKKWGCQLSDDDCDAFLHAWLVVGHIMGIEDGLLPANYRNAHELFAQIKRRQVSGTDMGKKLTHTLQLFLASYLPESMRQDVPFMLIASQLSPHDANLIRPDNTPPPSTQNKWLLTIGFGVLKIYYAFKAWIVQRFPAAGSLLGRSFTIAGEALIDSWRDGFARRPFYIPDTVNGGWKVQDGMDNEVRRELRTWRQKLFTTVFQGLAILIATTLLSAVVGVAGAWYLIEEQTSWVMTLIVFLALPIATCAIGWTLATSFLTNRVRAIVAQRPGPTEPGIAIPQ
jgi:ER-bound oxygenase mpaB/B'/Rubber oxygenase, catalytic domain